MAGKGSRFVNAGYMIPKPLIEIHGVPMIKLVIDNLTPKREHRFIFIVQRSHFEAYELDYKLHSYAKNVEIIAIDSVTQGQACSVLLAKDLFNTDEPLMTANSDQYIDTDINDYLEDMDQRQLDGLIMSMYSCDPKWSYARLDEKGLVVETAEKRVISDNATVGIFNFKKGRDFVRSAERMIEENLRVAGEFYTCPVYNYLIDEGQKIGIYNIGTEYNGMYGLGIPQDLEFFAQHEISRTIGKK